LELPGKQFFVDEACSGIVSVMSVIATGAIYVVWRNRSLQHSIVLLLAGVAWAVVMNVGRVTTIALAHAWWSRDLSTGWQHDVLGLVLFCITFLALISTDALLVFFFDPVLLTLTTGNSKWLATLWNRTLIAFDPRQTSQQAVSHTTTSHEQRANSGALSPRFCLAVGAICLCLGGLQIVSLVRGYSDSDEPVQLAMAINGDFFPQEVGKWEKIDFKQVERVMGDEFGDFSRQFTYRHRETSTEATISFDFPYRGGWHELSVCYRNFGWPLVSRTVHDYALGDSGDNWKVINADYAKPEGIHGFLAFSGTNGAGECLAPPSRLVLWRPWFRLRRRLLRRVSPRFFQFQAWVSQDHEISDATKMAVMELFLDLRVKTREHLAKGREPQLAKGAYDAS
ncbi:MAG: exosortase U, partial [Pseudomonadales bacterium]